MVEKILSQNEVIAIIIKGDYSEKGVHFFTPDDYSQQLAFMKHPEGKTIDPHIHNQLKREVFYTEEVLFIKKGKLRVDFFDNNRNYLESRVLEKNDVILLVKGGHGFEVLEEIEMFEVKQGPYAGDTDKTRFNAEIKELKLK